MARFGQMTKDPLAKGPIIRSPATEGCHHYCAAIWEAGEYKALWNLHNGERVGIKEGGEAG